MSKSPKKKWTSLREQTEKKKKLEAENKLLVNVATLEYDYGKYFYELFYTASNLLLYYRGLHSKKFFAFRENRMFSMEIPYMRFPETILYLEKVSQKAASLLLGGYLDAFMFEERDRYGNSMLFMFRLHGTTVINPQVISNRTEVLESLKQGCISLLSELKRTLLSMPAITQTNMFRWKVELGLRKVDRPDSKWRNNSQGIFVDDPDWKHFPWLRSTRETKKSSSDQGTPTETSPIIIDASSSSPIATNGGSDDAVDEFFGTNNFQDVELEEDMGGSPVKKDYEKEGLSVIEYPEDSSERPGSPDMFAEEEEIEKFQAPELASVSYHMASSGIHMDSMKPPAIFTQISSSSEASDTEKLEGFVNGLPDRDSSIEDYKDATNIFDEVDDLDDFNHALDLIEQDPDCMDFDVLLADVTDTSDVKFFAVATEDLTDTLVCNILVFKDTQVDKLHSDYKPAPMKKKGKRSEK